MNNNSASVLLKIASAALAGHPVGMTAVAVGTLALNAMQAGRDLTQDEMDRAWADLESSDEDAEEAIKNYRERLSNKKPETVDER